MSDANSGKSNESEKKSLSFNQTSSEKFLALSFVENNGAPLANLVVKVTAGKQTYEYRTDYKGKLSPFKFTGDTTECTVSALLPTGKYDVVMIAPLNNALQHYTCRTPYVLSTILTPVHTEAAEKKSEDKKPAEKKTEANSGNAATPVGTTESVRSPNGNPVVKATVPETGDNLQLAPNEKYRKVILDTANLHEMLPQTFAALMNAEAGKMVVQGEKIHDAIPEKKVLKKQKVLQDKKVDGVIQISKKTGKPIKIWVEIETEVTIPPVPEKYKMITGVWDPNSENYQKNKKGDLVVNAAGLTQFIPSTWIGMLVDKEGNVHQKSALFKPALEIKAIENRPIEARDEVRKIIKPHKDAVMGKNGKIITKEQKAVSKVISPAVKAKPENYVFIDNKTNREALLKLRYNPDLAIQLSGELAVVNMTALEKAFGEKIGKVSKIDKAKFYYLAHHLGASDAVKFINNTIPNDTDTKGNAYYLLKPQMGSGAKAEARADEMVAVEEDEGVDESLAKVFAHRRWLITFIDKTIKPQEFVAVPESIAKPQSLYDLIKQIGGEHPDGFVVPPKSIH